jgi:hypothetical protein
MGAPYTGPFKGPIDGFKLCRRCTTPYERTERGPVPRPKGFMRPEIRTVERQLCGCRRLALDEAVWPRFDFNERLHLCECCFVPLGSGSKYSVWFCQGCRDAVVAFNRSVGSSVIPIGRHTFHAGIGMPSERIEGIGQDEPGAVRAVDEFRTTLRGWLDTIDRLHGWSEGRRSELIDRWFPGTSDPALTAFLGRLRATRERDASFELETWREAFLRDLG